MEFKSLFISSVFLSGIKYLLFQTVLTFIPDAYLVLKLVNLTFSTFILIVNFHPVSSVSIVHVLFMRKVPTPDLLLQCHMSLESEPMEALLIFVLSDYLGRLFQLTNFSLNNIELVKSLLFIYFLVEGFFINLVGIVLLLGIIQNLVLLIKYFSFEFSQLRKGVMMRINLILLISFWLYCFLLVIPFNYFYQILYLQCDEVADHRLETFKFVFFSYYVVEMCLSPIVEYQKLLRKELSIISKVLKWFSYSSSSKNVIRSNLAELDKSKTETKTFLTGSLKNTKNQLMMMKIMRCVILFKKKAKRIKERNKSENRKSSQN